jgi:hypothetical protein
MVVLDETVSRCEGVGSDEEGWREGCENCLRRTTPPVHPDRPWLMDPPEIIVFECPFRLEPYVRGNSTSG